MKTARILTITLIGAMVFLFTPQPVRSDVDKCKQVQRICDQQLSHLIVTLKRVSINCRDANGECVNAVRQLKIRYSELRRDCEKKIAEVCKKKPPRK